MGNPFAFRNCQVAFWTVTIYVGIILALLIVHETVPPAPATSPNGLDLDQAWADLGQISNAYHPFNSHRNDEVRDWLIRRISEDLDASGTPWRTVTWMAQSKGSPPEMPFRSVIHTHCNSTSKERVSNPSICPYVVRIFLVARSQRPRARLDPLRSCCSTTDSPTSPLPHQDPLLGHRQPASLGELVRATRGRTSMYTFEVNTTRMATGGMRCRAAMD